MKYNIDELKKMYHNNEECIKQINIDINEVKNTLNYYNEKSKEMAAVQQNLLEQISQIESEMKHEETTSNCQGVMIDYKLFSEILSVLTTAKQCNLCTQEFFDNVVQAGKDSEIKKEAQIEQQKQNNVALELTNNNVDENREIDRDFIEDLLKKAILKSILSTKIN